MVDADPLDFVSRFFPINFLPTIYAACIKLKHLVRKGLIRLVEKLSAHLDIKKY